MWSVNAVSKWLEVIHYQWELAGNISIRDHWWCNQIGHSTLCKCTCSELPMKLMWSSVGYSSQVETQPKCSLVHIKTPLIPSAILEILTACVKKKKKKKKPIPNKGPESINVQDLQVVLLVLCFVNSLKCPQTMSFLQSGWKKPQAFEGLRLPLIQKV